MAFEAKKQVLACLLQTFTPYAQSRSLLKYVNLRLCEISPINLALRQVALIAASCCAGPIRSVVVFVVGVHVVLLPVPTVLMLALTFAPCVLTAPCILTFVPCACGVYFLSTCATIQLVLVMVVTSCNLCWWWFSSSHWRKYCTCTQATCSVWW